MVRYTTERARTWFSHRVRHLARKQSGSILTTLEPARGFQVYNLMLGHVDCNGRQNCKAIG